MTRAHAIYRENPVSAMQSNIAADVLRTFADSFSQNKPIRVLEIGAGSGGTTAFLLPMLSAERSRYVFTDVSSFFIDHAKREFTEFPFVEYRMFDINEAPATQQIESGSFDVIVATNVLHNARRIDATMRQLRSTLAPGGLLLLIEGTQNGATELLTFGHIESFEHFEDWRLQGGGPLLSADEWRDCLMKAGFAQFACAGEGHGFDGNMRQCTFVAQAPLHTPRVDPLALRNALQASLPGYMVPHHIVALEEFPLSPNGKVDYNALPTPWGDRGDAQAVAPRSAIERRLHDIWCAALEVDSFGVEDNFFEIGGNSLIAVHIGARVQQEFVLQEEARENLLRHLFENPTISAFAVFVRQGQLGGDDE